MNVPFGLKLKPLRKVTGRPALSGKEAYEFLYQVSASRKGAGKAKQL